MVTTRTFASGLSGRQKAGATTWRILLAMVALIWGTSLVWVDHACAQTAQTEQQGQTPTISLGVQTGGATSLAVSVRKEGPKTPKELTCNDCSGLVPTHPFLSFLPTNERGVLWILAIVSIFFAWLLSSTLFDWLVHMGKNILPSLTGSMLVFCLLSWGSVAFIFATAALGPCWCVGLESPKTGDASRIIINATAVLENFQLTKEITLFLIVTVFLAIWASVKSWSRLSISFRQ